MYERWASETLQSPYAAEEFIRFLKRPAALPLREPGLAWLFDTGIGEPQRQSHRDDRVLEELAELLDQALRDDHRLLDGPAEAAFKGLLRRLVDRQVPLALVLADRLAGR